MNLINQRVGVVCRPEDDVRLIEYAARTCYASYDKITHDSAPEMIRKLVRHGHTAPLEFGRMVVELVIGRDVLAEITRHRLCSFCVESQRYVNYSKHEGLSFIIPSWYVPSGDEYASSDKYAASRLWEQQMRDAEEAYLMMVNGYKMKPEEARVVLPNSTACRLVMSANVREWRAIFSLRCSDAAYPPMRDIMRLLYGEVMKTCPECFEDIM